MNARADAAAGGIDSGGSSGEDHWFVIEEDAVFSESILWSMQRRYYHQSGVGAWRRQEIPLYVTSNPFIANAYAEIVFAFGRDVARSGGSASEPLHVWELGGGPGRFAFHFLDRLSRLCRSSGVPLSRFRYVLTDDASANVDSWKAHGRFSAWLEAGVLDFARFDVCTSASLSLEMSGERFGPSSLEQPLVVIGNYVFDSVPQDLLYIDAAGGCHPCLISLAVGEEPDSLSDKQLLDSLEVRYHCAEGEPPAFDEPWMDELIAGYRRSLPDTHLLLPSSAIACLRRLRAIAPAGLLLLAADKGTHLLTALQGQPPPGLVRHGGCFSLDVNFHALKGLCELGGGTALFPPSPAQRHIDVGAFIFADEPQRFLETLQAFERHVGEFGPDDFYDLVQSSWRSPGQLGVAEILAFLRLSHHDGYLLAHYLPRLSELVPEMGSADRAAVCSALERAWDSYFWLAEPFDLAHEIGCLLYEMDDFGRALHYFERSVEIYGDDPRTSYNMAQCHRLLGDPKAAADLAEQVLLVAPDHERARALLEELSSSGVQPG